MGDSQVTVDGQAAHLVECPACGGVVVVALADVNCAIFRHAALRATGEPVNPHASQAELEGLRASGALAGCGAPFRLVGGRAEACGYL